MDAPLTKGNSAPLRSTSLSPEFEARVGRELDVGERVLWTGQPHPRRYSRTAWLGIPLGLPFAIFGLYWLLRIPDLVAEVGAEEGVAGKLAMTFPIFGIAPLLVGLFFFTLPYWTARQARRTFYALTDRRALLFETSLLGTTTVHAITLARMDGAFRRDRADGGGDLILQQIDCIDDDGNRVRLERGFLAIDDVRAVEGLLRETLLKQPVQKS